MTAAQLEAVHAALAAIRDEMQESPEWCEDTPLGLLCSADDDAIAAAARVVHRLYLNAKYPKINRAIDYLAPKLAPVA